MAENVGKGTSSNTVPQKETRGNKGNHHDQFNGILHDLCSISRTLRALFVATCTALPVMTNILVILPVSGSLWLVKRRSSSGRATSRRQVEGGGEQGERWLVHSTIWNGPFQIKENIRHLASLKCLAYGCVIKKWCEVHDIHRNRSTSPAYATHGIVCWSHGQGSPSCLLQQSTVHCNLCPFAHGALVPICNLNLNLIGRVWTRGDRAYGYWQWKAPHWTAKRARMQRE